MLMSSTGIHGPSASVIPDINKCSVNTTAPKKYQHNGDGSAWKKQEWSREERKYNQEMQGSEKKWKKNFQRTDALRKHTTGCMYFKDKSNESVTFFL